MSSLIPQLVNALSLGSTYALLALGLATVFGILGLINFAHGELMTISGYALAFAALAGFPFPLCVLLGCIAAIIAAVAMERIAFRPLRGSDTASMLLSSFAVSAVLQVLFHNMISGRFITAPVPAWMMSTVSFGNVEINRIHLLTIGVTAVFLAGLTVFLRKAPLGLAMRAASVDFAVTRLMGVRANLVIATAFALSGLLAGVASIMWLAQRGGVDPWMGFTPVLKAFVAVILGGLGSMIGAVTGGFALAFIEISLRGFLPTAFLPFSDAISFVFVIALLLYRPEGLFGHRIEQRR
jgi:branched-chain amino acid transport system permease protein